jgi:uncharacterized protein
VSERPSAEVSLAAVLAATDAAGRPGKAVKELAGELGGMRVRFKPLLPLGRANGDEKAAPDANWAALKRDDALAYGFQPHTSCGLGYSLYVAPDGACYPCYALAGQADHMGNALDTGGLRAIIHSDRYRALAARTVDTDPQCQTCPLRYLCGGVCRAWAHHSGTNSAGSLREDCQPLRARAWTMLANALSVLDVARERWEAAGLPWPEEVNVR